MSDDTGKLDEFSVEEISGMWQPLVAIIAGIAIFLVRLKGTGLMYNSGDVAFPTQDAWYQYRSVQYTVANWPDTIGFDPWVGYPTGSTTALFGTLYDQVIAALALLIGLGDPSEAIVGTVLIYTPPLAAALTVVPVYFLAKRLSGKTAGGVASVILFLSIGPFLEQTLAGRADYQAVVPLLVTGSMYALTRAFDYSRATGVTLTTLHIPALRPALISSIVSGIALTVLVHVWPLGVLMFVPFTIFILIDASKSHVLGGNPTPTLVSSATAFALVGLSSLPAAVRETSFSLTSIGIPHVIVPLGLAALCVIFQQLSVRPAAESNQQLYPVAISAITLASIFVLFIASQDAFNAVLTMFLVSVDVTRSVFPGGFAMGGTLQQIAYTSYLLFGGMIALAVVGVAGLVVDWLRDGNSKYALVLVTTVLLFALSISQVEFVLYATPLIAVAGGCGLYYILKLFDIPTQIPNLHAYQYIAIGLALLVFIPSLYPVAGATVFTSNPPNSPGEYGSWHGSLNWMEDNTPDEPLSLNGNYNQNTFAYPNNSYGVLSWIGQSNWIPLEGKRLSVTNGFGQNSGLAAQYLLAQSGPSAHRIARGANIKYVAISSNMVSPSRTFPRIISAHPRFRPSQFYRPLYSIQTQQRIGVIKSTPYYMSLAFRLFHYHGSAKPLDPVVVDWQVPQRGIAATLANGTVKQFPSLQSAQQYISNENTSQLGGVGTSPTRPIPALRHFRLVHVSQARQPTVKIFEKVPGATLTGTAPANTTVTARVILKPANGNRFSYTFASLANRNGTFRMTLPYATTGYNATFEHHANTTIRALTKYRLTAVKNNATYTTTTSVTETQVLTSGTLNVTLTQQTNSSRTP